MQRIIWRHRWLLIAFLFLPIAVVIPLRMAGPIAYASTASIQAQNTAPDADTQVQAILGRVSAVATNPALVAKAIGAVHVDRNATDVARTAIATTSLGSSAIVQLTVTDRSRQDAVLLARSLADAVVGQLNGLSSPYAAELAALTAQNHALIAQRNRLLRELGNDQGQSVSPAFQAQLESLTAVNNQLVANAQAQQQIQTSIGGTASAQIVTLPTFASEVSRHVVAYGALAGLFGLIVGLLIATVHELARPTVGQPSAGARELGLILLGNVWTERGRATALDADLATRLDLAAHRLGSQTLVLCGPVPPAQLTALTRQLTDALRCTASSNGADHARASSISAVPGHIEDSSGHRMGSSGDTRRVPAAVGTISQHSLGIGSARSACTASALADLTLGTYPDDPALVIVLPRFAPRVALDRAADLGVTTGWPILGVIGMHRRTAHGWPPERVRRHAPAPAAREPVASARIGERGVNPGINSGQET
jgi:capsular polysaccharide biosynthesis protein